MLCVLKGFHPNEGELLQEFTLGEKETAIAIGRIWYARGWFPRLYVKSYDGRFNWLTSHLIGQRKAA